MGAAPKAVPRNWTEILVESGANVLVVSNTLVAEFHRTSDGKMIVGRAIGARNRPDIDWRKLARGSHLVRYQDGSIELVWNGNPVRHNMSDKIAQFITGPNAQVFRRPRIRGKLASIN